MMVQIPDVRPQINYGQIIQILMLAVTLGGVIWAMATSQRAIEGRLDAQAASLLKLEEANRLVLIQMSDLKSDISEIKGRLMPARK